MYIKTFFFNVYINFIFFLGGGGVAAVSLGLLDRHQVGPALLSVCVRGCVRTDFNLMSSTISQHYAIKVSSNLVNNLFLYRVD